MPQVSFVWREPTAMIRDPGGLPGRILSALVVAATSTAGPAFPAASTAVTVYVYVVAGLSTMFVQDRFAVVATWFPLRVMR